MISSIVATLNPAEPAKLAAFAQLKQRAEIELGDLIENRLLPMTIEAENSQELEETTRWVQNLDGIDFVDVVFVHLEEQQQT